MDPNSFSFGDFRTDFRVALSRCEAYDPDRIEAVLREHLERLGIPDSAFAGKSVVIKPNLVAKRRPEQAATTHPAFVQATVRILKKAGAAVAIAESPGGTYSPAALRDAYRASGFLEIAEREGAVFNYDVSAQYVKAPEGRICREFHLIRPIAEADIVVDLCKLKTHAYTMMTAAVKNFYGTVPGTEKVEMHARFSDPENFFCMLNDLCQCICERKPVLVICDGVLAMEGEGPGTGDPRFLGVCLSGLNPFAVDLACSHIIGFDGRVPMIEEAKTRGFCPESASALTVPGTPLDDVRVTDFKVPQSRELDREIRMIPAFVKPHPVIDGKRCVGCGICAASCPRKAIAIRNRRAHIRRSRCIRCFCCQEMCPHKAVRVKRSPLFTALLK